MKNKTEDLKTILIELITDVYRGFTGDGEPYVRYNTEKASNKILKLFNTEQINKEAKRSARQLDLACEAIDEIYDIADTETEKILRKYFKAVDKLNKQNENTK